MEIVLLAKSSSHPEEPYRVTFRLNDGKLQILCTCPAGEFGQLCKHKVSLASNNCKMLFDTNDPKQKEQLGQIQKWVQASGLPALIEEVSRTEKELEELKKRLKNAKAMAGRAMTEGLK